MPDKKPTDIGLKRYSRVGMLSDCQRAMYFFLIKRSAQGLWTCYHDAKSAGIECPSRLVPELLSKNGLFIAKKMALYKRTSTGAIQVPYFCVWK